MTFLARQYKLWGVVFLALVVLSVYLVYATFTKKFTDYDKVKVDTSVIGLQLPARADVKIRGVIVGEVLDMSATADGAELTLGLYPSQIHTIPANVTHPWPSTGTSRRTSARCAERGALGADMDWAS